MTAAAILIFDNLRGRLRLTTARRLSAYMSSRALAMTRSSSSYCFVNFNLLLPRSGYSIDISTKLCSTNENMKYNLMQKICDASKKLQLAQLSQRSRASLPVVKILLSCMIILSRVYRCLSAFVTTAYLVSSPRQSEILVKNRNFFIPHVHVHSTSPLWGWIPVQILPYVWCGNNRMVRLSTVRVVK